MPKANAKAGFAADQLYRAKFSERTTIVGRPVFPGREYEVLGAELSKVAEIVATAEPIEE
jgi:hypothetical protein